MKITEHGSAITVEADPGKFLHFRGVGVGKKAVTTRAGLDDIREISTEEAERIRADQLPQEAPEENP